MSSAWRRRLSANLGYLWRDLPLLDRIARAAANGFSAIELHDPSDDEPEAVARACREADLLLLGVNTRSATAALPALEEAFRADFQQVLGWCERAGGRSVHILAGGPDETRAAASRATLVRNIAWAAELAAARRIDVLLEPLNRIDRPTWFYHKPEEAAAVMREVDRPNVGIQFDTYHVIREGLDPLASFLEHRNLVRHVQIAAAPGRTEPHEGEFDHAAFLSLLSAHGYDGWIGCEYTPRTTVEAGLGWRESLEQRMDHE